MQFSYGWGDGDQRRCVIYPHSFCAILDVSLVIIMRDGIAVDVGCCSPSPPDLVGIVAICVE